MSLSEAGFYYLNIGDRVKCFSCKQGLSRWEIHDDPWVEHAIVQPQCKYLNQVKESEFIQNASKVKSDNINMINSTINNINSTLTTINNIFKSNSNINNIDVNVCGDNINNIGILHTIANTAVHNNNNNNVDVCGNNRNNEYELRDLCKVCMERSCINIVITPCMHVCVCMICGLELNECPICKKDKIQIKKLYFS